MKELGISNPDRFHSVLILTVTISIGITAAHFIVPHSYPVIHGFLRRLYYIPLILTALLYGFRKTIYLIIFIAISYSPFILFQWGRNALSANLEEIYEILLFAVVGGITAVLSDREKERRKELQEAYHDTVLRLAIAAEYKDENTGAHLNRISRYAELIAGNLHLPPHQVELIKSAAPMHDIGKIGIPDRILTGQGKLNDDEWKIMKSHTAMGHEILKESHSALLEMAAEIALAHHEKFDGTGYPKGLRGNQIPLAARIITVADVFDALTTSRPYKPGITMEETLQDMEKEIGTHFDPDVFAAFIKDPGQIRHIMLSVR